MNRLLHRLRFWWRTAPDPRARKHPFEAWITALIVVGSVSQLRFGVNPLSVNSRLPDEIQTGLSLLTLLGSAFTCAGIIDDDDRRGSWLELTGMAGSVWALGVYAYGVVATTPGTFTSSLGGVVLLAVLGATVHRGVQILRFLRSDR